VHYSDAWVGVTTVLCGVGVFAAESYWSSSQNDANNAWNQNFDNGNQNNDNKNNTNRVRPVRVFTTVKICVGGGSNRWLGPSFLTADEE
jgi:hypothetical protein